MSARTLLVTSVFLIALTAMVRPAAAEDPGKVFSGKIMMSSKRFPMTSKSQSAYIASVRKLSQSNFNEDKATHTWTIYFTAFLKTPLNDVEYVIKYYEMGRAGQQLLATAENFNDARGQTTINSKIVLDKKMVGVNKDIMMTIENKGKVYASSRFKILGEGERFSGKVNFSEDDAAGKDKENE